MQNPHNKTRRKPPEPPAAGGSAKQITHKNSKAKTSLHLTTPTTTTALVPLALVCLLLLPLLVSVGEEHELSRSSDTRWPIWPRLIQGASSLVLDDGTNILRDQEPKAATGNKTTSKANRPTTTTTRQKVVSKSDHKAAKVSQQLAAGEPQTAAKSSSNGGKTRRIHLIKAADHQTGGSRRTLVQQPLEDYDNGLQISITPRNGQIRVPVGENTILKCLISSQVNKFTRKFDVHWSRYMYDENLYEHIDSGPSEASTTPASSDALPLPDAPPTSSDTSLNPDLAPWQQQPPINRQQQLRDFQARSRQETNPISDLLIEATLSISPVFASDNATYYCTASDGATAPATPPEQNRARIDLVALSRPVVRLERVQPARDSKSALVQWLVLSHGNTPIKRTILMVRNDSLHHHHHQQQHQQQRPSSSVSQLDLDPATGFGSSVVVDSDHNQWQRIDIPGDGELAPEGADPRLALRPEAAGLLPNNNDDDDNVVRAADVDITSIGGGGGGGGGEEELATRRFNSLHRPGGRARFEDPRRRRRSFNLTHLLPGVTYTLRLAAINDMGQSNWTQLSATMPNEIPAQIGEVFLLSRSNDSLAIGWKRPAYDGAKTIRYEMQLFDLNRTLTLDANTNTSASSGRTNFMYIFVGLNPGTDYHFHVRACSRAGCSAFSTPKLLASTVDGEPDEPIDVELSCQVPASPQPPDSNGNSSPPLGNASVSWLPPVNARGQLTNYSVALESQSRHLNESGEWQVDEWRTDLETADNHTLSLELGSILLPNTNYSVRVCANNRSKHCGRYSAVSGRARCSMPPELPASLPAFGLRFAKPPRTAPQGSEPRPPEMESLLLEVPPLSLRNGTIDCLQVVLIRLPSSYSKGGGQQLEQFLPREPSDIRLVSYSEMRHSINSDQTTTSEPPGASTSGPDGRQPQQAATGERAFAYLAEEVAVPQVAGATPIGQLVLGDGRTQSCSQRLSQEPLAARPNGRAFDGALRPLTYYTGFVRLLLVRQAPSGGRAELLQKYSGYLEPVRTGESVILVAASGADEGPSAAGDDDDVMINPFSMQYFNNRSVTFNEFAGHVGASLRSNAEKLYRSTSSFVAANFRLEKLSNYIMRSSPAAQLLEVGLLVIGLSLFLLLLIYLVNLPNSLRRRRKRKLKRQLQKHQEAATAAAEPNFLMSGQHPTAHHHGQDGGYAEQQVDAAEAAYAGQEQDNLLEESLQEQNYQQRQLGDSFHHHQQADYGTSVANGRECPIHSSPAQSQQQQLIRQDQSGPPVHVCQPLSPDYQVSRPSAAAAAYGTLNYHHAHHHHHHHHRQQQQQPSSHQVGYQMESEMKQQQDQYERNCRTTARRSQANVMAMGGTAASQLAYASNGQDGASSRNFTLNVHNSVLALAKKINKSVPLSLFGPVLECRLRNNWLREEYEQLPRQQLQMDGPEQQQQRRLLLGLRPQLIVSRNDTVSALISGNDLYDASLLRPAGVPAVNGALGGQQERRIICAKSPLDADSVWDFWRLVYEQEVSTVVMLTQTEDQQTGELRCAQYWPTCDNEETTILSPCNEYVQKSSILPAKFKIRQETLAADEPDSGQVEHFRVRRLTLMVMATRPGENEQNDERRSSDAAGGDKESAGRADEAGEPSGEQTGGASAHPEEEEEPDEDEEDLIIVERTILHLQYCYWNTSSLANQMRLIKFIELANERHNSRSAGQQEQQQQESPNSISSPSAAGGAMLVHCFNGLGRSGLFTAMSFVIDELSIKLGQQQQQSARGQLQQPAPKVNLFQLVSRLRSQREMILSPYRLYELLYQLTLNCIPPGQLVADHYGGHQQHKHQYQYQPHQQMLVQQQQQAQH